MTVEFSVIEDVPGLREIEQQWHDLAHAAGSGALFRGPQWLIPWWHAYHVVLGAALRVYQGRVDGVLVCLAPLYTRLARMGPGVKVREIRLMGDAGPRPPALDLLVAQGFEERCGAALAQTLTAEAADWDVIDLEPLRDPSPMRAFFAARLSGAGLLVESKHCGGGARRIALAVAGVGVTDDTQTTSLASAYVDDIVALRKGMSAFRRLSRLEWAAREETSPLADAEALQLLEEVALDLGEHGKARLARLDDSSREAVATALVVDDGDRAVVLAMAVDPESGDHKAPARLLAAEARAAAERGLVALDVVVGASEYELPALPNSRTRALNLRVYSGSRAATVARTYGAVIRRVGAARDAPGTAAAGARAAWAKIRTAAANMASYERLQLYRGELWTRGIPLPEGLSLCLFAETDFDALDDLARAEMIEVLELDEVYSRQKWQRGDMVVLARLHGRPAGVTWCARTPVEVPERGRALRLSASEADIHDVFVAPQARGRTVAPSMLEFLAHELRQCDVYRSWALIGSNNAASIRAFEKAAYAAVCDVIYARRANVDRLIVRPPVPEATHLLGLS